MWTTSAGNMAQGVAWMAQDLGVPATIVAPDHAPRAKTDAIERLGGRSIRVPFDRWWQAMEEGSYPGVEGLFVHPVMDEKVMAGNGTIGLELVEQLDGIDTVLIPWGGGGLTTGIASALARALARDEGLRVRARDRRAGDRRARERRRARAGRLPASFVDGVGLEGAAAARCGSGPSRCSPARSRSRSTRRRRRCGCSPSERIVVAEGAGALAVAAARLGPAGAGRLVCIVSGGNIDSDRLAAILEGETPT